jgi:hypothetical protein
MTTGGSGPIHEEVMQKCPHLSETAVDGVLLPDGSDVTSLVEAAACTGASARKKTRLNLSFAVNYQSSMTGLGHSINVTPFPIGCVHQYGTTHQDSRWLSNLQEKSMP